MRVSSNRRRIYSDDEIDEVMVPEGEVVVDPEATDLLFETEDVAELMAEVTGEDIDVTADGDEVTFGVGDEEFTVSAEGDEEILEASHKRLAGKRTVSASTRRTSARRPVSASKKTSQKKSYTVRAHK